MSSGVPAIALGSIVFLAVVSLFMCFSSLEYTELGLNYSYISSSVDPRGYGAGRYFLGFGHSFLKFPSTVQSIQFSGEYDSSGGALRSRTADGLEVTLEVSFQYQINASAVYDLYQKFGTNYLPIYVNMAIDVITTSSTKYLATTYFQNRSVIAYQMETLLRDTFENQALATIPFFQLRSVGLPADYNTAIQETEMMKQDIQTANAEMSNKIVDMETKVLQAQQQALQIAFQANGTAQQTLLMVQAYVEQFRITQEMEAEGFQGVLEELGNDETRFLEYLNVRALRDHPAALTVVSMANGAALPNAGTIL